MEINPARCTVFRVHIMYLVIFFSIGMIRGKIQRWFIGRAPPSHFEYPRINGFYSPKQAKAICEKDVQCGGFTFKGTKRIKYIVPEVYFFHFINESSSYLTTEVKHPHWTSYIVGSRDHIVVNGSYSMNDCLRWRRLNGYVTCPLNV